MRRSSIPRRRRPTTSIRSAPAPSCSRSARKANSITLVKAPTYRDAASIKLNTVIFKVVKDPSAQVSALLAGDVDTFPGFQAPELVERLKKDARFAVVVGTTEGEVILATNNGKKPFDNPKVRQAMAHAHQPRRADRRRVRLRHADRQPLRAAQQGLYRPDQDLSARYRQGQGAARRGGLSQRFRGQPQAAAGRLCPARRRGAGEPARQDRHQGRDHPAAVAAVALRGVQGAQLRPHDRGPHRGQRPRSLCARRLLLELQLAGVQGQVARGRRRHRLRQARRAPEGLPAHHRARRGERLTSTSSPRSASGRRNWSACGRTRRRRTT